MGRSQQTFNKKEREKKKKKRKKDKAERRDQRKIDRSESVKKTFEEQLSYVDEYGNVTSTPPDPTKKKEVIKIEDIVLGIPPKDKSSEDPMRSGVVKYFNDEKGYGFIIDHESNESIFVHVNQADGPLAERDKVTFEIERGPKGLSAVNVKIVSA